MTERTFDRLPEFDPRSRQYPVRALIHASLQPRTQTWTCPVRLDQGEEGACVGFGWAHELAAGPVKETGITNEAAQAIYHRAQDLDSFPNTEPGTSVLAGAKAVIERGDLAEYRWAFGVDDVVLTLGYRGPVVCGLNWHEGMKDVDPKGFITPWGSILGGHCVVLIGVDIEGGFVRGINSWGEDWGYRGGLGRGGNFKLMIHDLTSLLSAGGEACIPVVRIR